MSDDETARWEALLGKAAGDEELFARKRRDAAARQKLDAFKDERRVANLPKRRLYAEPGSVSLPRFAVHDWLVGESGRKGDWSLMDVGLLVGLLAAFANKDPALVVGARFEEANGELTLVAPGGIGAEQRLHGQTAGSPLENGSGHIRVRPTLATLARNNWVVVDQTAGELRVRLGERARSVNSAN